MLKDQNPHEPGQCFTEDFFRAQWKKQRDFEINRNETDRLKKEEQAQFFERGEVLKSLA
jgi:hypothetical protein